MPVSHRWQGHTLVIRCDGEYTTNDVISVFEAAITPQNRPADAGLVLDLRTAQSLLRRPVAEMRRITECFLVHAPEFGDRIALLVEGRARYGLMRMASTWISFKGVEGEIFFDEGDALAWLDGFRSHARED